MNRIERLATYRPVTFGFGVTIVYILMLIASAVLGAVWPGSGDAYGQPGAIVGRGLSITILLAALARLGWLRPVGFTSPDHRGAWLITLLLLAYSSAASVYAMTGSLDFSLSDTPLSGLVTLFILADAFTQEVAFRGLVMYGFVRVWGDSNHGLVKSVLVSSLFFGSLHIFDFLSGTPLANVLMQSVEAFLLGILWGTLVLSAKSIYPAAFFHGILNIGGFLALASVDLEPTPSSWLLLSLLIVPPAIYGLYTLRQVSQRTIVLDVA